MGGWLGERVAHAQPFQGTALPQRIEKMDTTPPTAEPEAIRAKIKEIIAQVASLDPAEIADDASFIDDLQLDSLSLLEIGVDVDYAFKLGVPEEKLQELRTVQDSVNLVLEHMDRSAAAPVEAG